VIVEDSAPPSVLIVGRLARGTAGEARRVVHVFGLAATDSTEATTELIRSQCGETFPRTDVEWLTPGVGMPCEPCLGLTGGEAARAPRRELGV
jgi:hypothetical protein